MSYLHEPQVEVEDDGYSIPKIVAAILVLVLIGAGTFIYFQQKKIKSTVAYLLDDKKQVESDLNTIIEKYNLAVDDNGNLSDDLRDERDRIIHFRDSVRDINVKDFGEIEKYKEQINSLKNKKRSSVVTPPIIAVNKTIEKIKRKSSTSKTASAKSGTNTNSLKEDTKNKTTQSISKNDIASTDETFAPIETKSIKPTDSKKESSSKKTTDYSTFVRVEIPPTYPGCKGSVSEKKACFTKKVKKHLARKFNNSIVEGLSLSPGKKRIWVNFDIDKFGNIVNVNSKAPKDLSSKAKNALENEATRVVKKLPKMLAARQNGNSVKINYSVPITFVIN